MGEFADAVGDRLRDALAERRPSLDWETEYRVGRRTDETAERIASRLSATPAR